MLKKSIIALLAVFLFTGTVYAASIIDGGTLTKNTKDGIRNGPAHVEFTIKEIVKCHANFLYGPFEARDVKVTIIDTNGAPIPKLKFANVKVQGGSLDSIKGNELNANLDRSGDTRITADVVNTGSFWGVFLCIFQFGDKISLAEHMWVGGIPGGYFYGPADVRMAVFYPRDFSDERDKRWYGWSCDNNGKLINIYSSPYKEYLRFEGPVSSNSMSN